MRQYRGWQRFHPGMVFLLTGFSLLAKRADLLVTGSTSRRLPDIPKGVQQNKEDEKEIQTIYDDEVV